MQNPPVGGNTTPQTTGPNTQDLEAQNKANQQQAMEMQKINLESQAFYSNLQTAKAVTDRADAFFKSVSDTMGRA